MNRGLIIKPAAEADLAEAQVWYDNQREGLGTEFLHCAEAKLSLIQRVPEMHQVIHHGVRRGSIRRFPFSIYTALRKKMSWCSQSCMTAVIRNDGKPG